MLFFEVVQNEPRRKGNSPRGSLDADRVCEDTYEQQEALRLVPLREALYGGRWRKDTPDHQLLQSNSVSGTEREAPRSQRAKRWEEDTGRNDPGLCLNKQAGQVNPL